MKAAIWRLAAACVCFTASSAFGATVQEVNVKKKTVSIELGDGETLAKGDEVCFFNAQNKKIDCGAITRVKGTVATVKLKSAKKMKRIKVGMLAGPAEGGADAGAAGDAAPAEASYAGKKSPFRVWGTYSPALATPATYAKLGYAAPTTDAPETLWKSDATVATALFGFNLQFGIPMGSFSLNPGFRFRSFTPSLIDSDFIPQKENPYVSTEQKATALGLFFDFQYFRMPVLSASSFWLSSGLDIDNSTVTLTATKKDDSGTVPEEEVASATSKLNVASLRASAGFDLVFAKPFGAFFGLTLMAPLAEFGGTFSGDLGENQARGQADPGEDLKKSIAHKKNSVAYEVSLGTMLAF